MGVDTSSQAGLRAPLSSSIWLGPWPKKATDPTNGGPSRLKYFFSFNNLCSHFSQGGLTFFVFFHFIIKFRVLFVSNKSWFLQSGTDGKKRFSDMHQYQSAS